MTLVKTGGVLKKTLLATAAMTAAAAVCYPREASDISKYSWNVTSDFATSMYHDLFDCEFVSHNFNCLLLMCQLFTEIAVT